MWTKQNIWKEFCKVFPNAQMRGCGFHLAQAVRRKVKELGLCSAYSGDPPMHQFIRRVLALQFLLAAHISPSLEKLRGKTRNNSLPTLLDYLLAIWLESSVWDVESWSLYGRSIRTNNDVEGWHRRINSRAGRSNLRFYSLIRLMHEEAR